MRTITKVNGKTAVILIPDTEIDKLALKDIADSNEAVVMITEASKFVDEIIPIGSVIIYAGK
jgi:hypothetical protein